MPMATVALEGKSFKDEQSVSEALSSNREVRAVSMLKSSYCNIEYVITVLNVNCWNLNTAVNDKPSTFSFIEVNHFVLKKKKKVSSYNSEKSHRKSLLNAYSLEIRKGHQMVTLKQCLRAISHIFT